jgi:oxygen-independent coproporphyrinogen-3 oxidase
MIAPRLDRSLIEKYNRPGPRYTSYPTALQFDPEMPPEVLLLDSAQNDSPLSLYFHLPFCESLCWFCACAKEITKDQAKADIYLNFLEKEIVNFCAAVAPEERPVEQLHYGGGSPSFLSPDQLRRLTSIWRNHFAISPGAEISVEIDPRTLTEAKVEALADGGFRRASFGVQDVNPAVQEAVHRVQPAELNRRTLQWLRAAGFRSVNVDLIYGLPLQTVATFRETLEEVLAYDPDRLAIFSYAHVPWVAPAQKILASKGGLPDAETKLSMLEMIIETLTSRGYRYIGMDHFAKVDDELSRAQEDGTLYRNFQGYSTKAGREIAGFGMSAISQTARTYRQNEKTLEAYYGSLRDGVHAIERGYVLTDEDLLRRRVITDLMCHGKLDYARYENALETSFTEHFAEALAQLRPMEADGLIEIRSDGIQVQPAGWLLVRNLAMCFDAYLRPTQNRHAQTI